MFRDAQTLLWSSAALTTTAVSTNCYDMGAPFRSGATQPDFSAGEPIGLIINVEVAALVAGTETYEFQVITATASDLTTGQLVIATTGTIATATAATKLAAGQIIVLPIPPGTITQRYVGAKIVSANSAGITVSAVLGRLDSVPYQKYYAQASTIS